MKEKGSMPSKIISGNWVLKRKRKKVPCGSVISCKKEDVSAVSPKNSASSKCRQISDIKSGRSSSKRKGNDGYYYECVICDLGGDLLCCESCPRTYHLECLDPPLKSIPNGKWECPYCIHKSDTPELIRHEGALSKRARTKLVTEDCQAESKSSSAVKLSQFLRGSVQGKKRSSMKGKSSLSREVHTKKNLDSSEVDLSFSGKPAQLNCGTSMDGLLFAAESGEDKNKSTFLEKERASDSSAMNTLLENKSSSAVKEASSVSKGIILEQNHGRVQRKSNLSSKIRYSREHLVSVLGVSSNSRKRKLNINRGESKKKSGSSNVKSPLRMIDKQKLKTESGSVKLQKKSASVGKRISASLEDAGSKKAIALQSVKHSLKPSGPLNHIDEGDRADKRGLLDDYFFGETPQVDRILGCRVQDQPGSSYRNPDMVASSNASGSGAQEILDRLPEKNSGCDALEAAKCSETQNSGDYSDDEKCIRNDVALNKLQVNQRSETKDCKRQYVKKMVETSSEGMNTTSKVGKEQGKTVLLVGDSSCPQLTGDEPDTFVGNAIINKIQRPFLAESALISKEVWFEFLVKWAGKSHIHDSWVPEAILKVLAKRKLDNYKAKYGTTAMNLCEDRWLQPQRVVSIHVSKDGITEAFIKWSGLPYDECTWEKVDEPVIQKSSQLLDLYNRFEREAFENDGHRDSSVKKGDRPLIEIPTLVEQPVELKGGNLFPHQLEALNWLRKCWHRSKNVILADEMGLGKTVSACAFLSSLYVEFKVKLPCLVLVPLSTMPNWMAEFASWAPDLNVVEYHGCAKARNLIRQYEWHGRYPNDLGKRTISYKFNVLLTTYEMVLADSSYLRGIPWEVLIVDEGHRLKNSSSKLFSLLNAFSFQHRLLLTGTPLQNNLGELYNLLNFLQPASFPSLSSFEEKFNDLTTAEKVEELKKLVVPHMLRRLKKDAMQNIPPKTERMVPVELSSVQAEYYRAMLTKNYQILRNIGKGIPQQSMLNIVMQLRKVCNHPYLIPGTEPESGSVEFLQEMRIKASAKLTLLHSMLKILCKEGHRVLIFSQMTKLLDILEDYLSVEYGPKSFERVDGSVSVADRQAAIARFNQDKSRFVFLLSTRSCGLGINLATADTVVIYDSDFNPHADIQAMNRAHRIGQSNRLLVYRLVVRASVEERILQLAKKKLMLDQLFVNKSGSQKEVEDILRWGTEELFGDSSGKDMRENDANKDEAAVDTENKSRRRTGGLGDVYKDKCTEGSNKILWDENAIFKLLDRSTLQFGSPDNSEADLENDMLGSVKALEWNDEPMEEEGRTDASIADDASASHSDKKEDNMAVGPEENEWDRLLRIRWEKYQSEEEAALGRGKRLRKAVSYREVYAPHLTEALSESGGDDDPDPEAEPEPGREYTPAGRALKAKYARLRTRQKERLAARKAFAESHLAERAHGPESIPHIHSSDVNENDVIAIIQSSGEKSKADNGFDKTEFQKSTSELTQKVGRLSKQKVSVFQNSPSKVLRHSTSEPISNLLPVLGLRAPNAPQAESSHRNISRYSGKEGSRPMCKSGTLSHAIPCLETCARTESPQAASCKSKFPDTSQEILQRNMRNCNVDDQLPVSSCMPSMGQGKGLDTVESSRASSIGFLERMGLPNLRYNENFLPKFPFVPKNFQGTHSELLPSLSLGRDEFGNGDMQVPSMIPFFPNLKVSSKDVPNCSQWESEMPPSLSLGQTPNTSSSLPENHRKVLENIMLRTGLGSSNFPKRKSKQDGWSEDELDSLWIGVRRHGQGSWDAMLRDPRLKFSKYKISTDLASRWKVEQLKLFDGYPVSKSNNAVKSVKPALFPSISDGMLVRALHGSRLGGPFHFQTHLTDMKLGFGDVASNLHHFDPSFPAGLYENFVPFPAWAPDRFPVNFAGDSSFAAPSDRPGTSSNVHMDPLASGNAFGARNSAPLGLISQSAGLGLQQDDEVPVSRSKMLASLVDRPLNMWQNISNEVGKAGPTTPSFLPSSSNGSKLQCLKGKEVAASESSSSSKEKLPHWLREAVVSAPSKLADPELPPAVSAVAESVRLLYAEEKPRIPPFVAPGPPPFRPEDPRKSLKKKRKKKQRVEPLLGCTSYNIAEASQDGQGGLPLPSSSHISGTGSIPSPAPPFPLLPPSVCGSLRLSSIGPDLYMAPPNVNQPSLILNSGRKTSSGLTPSREVLQLVASCMAPGPSAPLTTLGMTTTFPESNIPSAAASDQEMLRTGSPCHVQSGRLSDLDQSVSKDSSKTESDIAPAAVRAGTEDVVSSEGTVSDDQTGDKEP